MAGKLEEHAKAVIASAADRRFGRVQPATEPINGTSGIRLNSAEAKARFFIERVVARHNIFD